MKKNSKIELTQPQRQSIWAIIFIILKFLRSFVRQAWVIFIPIVLGRGRASSGWDTWEIAIAAMGVFSTIWSIIAYFRYYYNLTESELVIRKGILNKSNINIPYERIQSVNFKQNFLHQILNVTEVAIDTAGSGEKEIQIDALTIEDAKSLRAEILERKKLENTTPEIEITQSEETESILTLSTSDLVKVGLTQNHLKPVSLVIGFIFSMYIYSWQLDLDPREIMRNTYSFFEGLSLIQSILLIILLVFFSVLYSVITTFLNHSNLSFFRKDKKFQLTQGLLTRKEIAAIDRKIQFMTWGQNLLQKAFGFFHISFEQAGAKSLKERINNFKIPGCRTEQIQYVRDAWMQNPSEIQDTEGVSIHMFYYSLRYIIFGFGSLMALQIYFESYKVLTFFFLLMIYSIYTSWLRYKKKRFSYDHNQLYISGGGLGFKFALMPTFKIQNVSINQTPYQWRRNLATVRIFTAAGALSIPFVTTKRAKDLLNFFIYQVEKSKKPWM